MPRWENRRLHKRRGHRIQPQDSRYDQGQVSGYQRRGYGQPNGGYYRQGNVRYNGQRCNSGMTGAIIDAIAGGLLGREIGRGGRFDRPSGTGLIVGEGAGALPGRAIGRSDCR